MIHSRPGFAQRTADDAPAKLNADMIPAINRKPLSEVSNLKHGDALDARAKVAMAKLAEQQKEGLLVNPSPSEPPKVLEAGK